MYAYCCKKCGSTEMFTQEKGNNIGLYCSECGTWVKWIGKDELRLFNHLKTQTKYDDYIQKMDEYLAYLKSLPKETAQKLAKENLIRCGILDENVEFTEKYR